MTILCIILVAFCCIHNNIILLTAPGTNAGVFVKVSRHPTALKSPKRLVIALMVFYTFLGFAARFKACRALKTWIKSTTAPRQRNQARHPGTKPAQIAAVPDHLQPVRGYAVNPWSRPGSALVRTN